MSTIHRRNGHTRSLGYLKYTGRLVEKGIIDARSATRAISGYDEAIRFFLAKTQPELSDIEIPLPLKFKTGSWVVELPAHAGTIIFAGAALVASSYFKKAAEKMAERDFDGVGLKDAIVRAASCVQWFARISKHLRHTNIRKASFRWDREDYAGIVGENGKILYVPRTLIKALAAAPVTLLSGMAKGIEPNRSLAIGARAGKRIEEVSIEQADKAIFADDDDDEEIVLPELKHGEHVTLEGVVTRGNEMTHTIGFWYKNRIITCKPRKGGIVRYKKQLFLNCRIKGEVTRLGRNGQPYERRPRITFDSLVALEPNEQFGFPFSVKTEDSESDN